jgi:hypothetical protein
MRTITNENGSVLYLNSGDWVESLTSLEYHNGAWKIHKFEDHQYPEITDEEEIKEENLDLKGKLDIGQLYNTLIQ